MPTEAGGSVEHSCRMVYHVQPAARPSRTLDAQVEVSQAKKFGGNVFHSLGCGAA